jgi:ribulose 1,5-bisphosphate synthetase/thiazole synthase
MLANHCVIVVGSGASGFLGCQELTEGGLKVVVFEVGTGHRP